MTVNFKSGSSDFDDVFIQRSYTTLDDVNVPGSLWSWGLNTDGALGLNDTTRRSSPTQVGSLTNWKTIDFGSRYAAAIKTDGSLWTWGGGDFKDKLGLGNNTSRSSPTQVGSLTNWKQVSAGAEETLAIKTDGTLWAWGHNYYGSLGIETRGSGSNVNSPVQVGTLTNWKQVDSGYFSSLAIKTDGTLWGWGANGSGRLGLGNTTSYSSPVQVGSLTNWKQVKSDEYATAAIKTDGTLWTWGQNAYGTLGHNNTTNYSSPVQVGSLTNWKQVAVGTGHLVAIKTDGTLWTWGSNAYGQLGQNDITNRSSPVQVGTLTNWKQVTADNNFTVAIKTDGTLWAWGKNTFGNLGLNDLTHRSSPVQIGSLTNWKQVSSSLREGNTLAIQSNL